MNRCVLFFMFCVLPVFSQAQYEWAPIGAIWHINKAWYFDPMDNPLFDFYTVEVTGDTVVAGLNARKVGDFITVQDGYKVYLWWQDTLRLIYDYSLQVGDTITFSLLDCDQTAHSELFTVDKVDTIVVDNLPLKQFYTSSVYGPNQGYYYEYVYIEKLGAPDLPINDHAYCHFTADHVPAWMRCYRDAAIYYRSDKFNQLAPNEECDVLSDVDNNEYQAFNLFPNPATAFTRLELGGLSNHHHELSVHVFNAAGQVIFKGVIPSNVTSYDIPVSSLSRGVYLLKLMNSEGAIIGMDKLVVE